MAVTPYLTLQSFMDDLIYTISTHKQINTVATGLISDFSTPKIPVNNNIIFPYVFLINDYIDIQVSPGGMSTQIVNIDLIICDQYIDNQQSILEVQSNMMSVATDIIASYTNTTGCAKPYRVLVPFKGRLRPFVERLKENVAGVELSIPFLIEQGLSRLHPLMTNI